MRSRFAFVILPAALLFSAFSYAQKPAEMVIGSIDDGYTISACGSDGRTLINRSHPQEVTAEQRRYFPEHSHWSLRGVSLDGSTVTYQLPEGFQPWSAAYIGLDLMVLATDVHPHKVPPHGPFYEMLHFDNQANLLGQQRVDIDFGPSQMAVLPSGKTILVGNYREPGQDEEKNVAAVIDTNGQMLKRTAFPLPPEGGGWTFVTYRLVADEEAAYMVLYSYDPPATGIAKISEDGDIDIKIIHPPTDNDERHHNAWLLGPGVAVEAYHSVPRTHCGFRFDEYDLNTDEKIATKGSTALGSGGCYTGSEITMLAPNVYVDPVSHVRQDTVRLVFGKLESLPTSPPQASANPKTGQ